MAAELLESSPVFRGAIQACAAALTPHGIDLMAEFARTDGWSSPALAMAGLSALQARAGARLRRARAGSPRGLPCACRCIPGTELPGKHAAAPRLPPSTPLKDRCSARVYVLKAEGRRCRAPAGAAPELRRAQRACAVR